LKAVDWKWHFDFHRLEPTNNLMEMPASSTPQLVAAQSELRRFDALADM